MSAVVTVTPTVMDGTVVRWYETEREALHREPMISASRNGVLVTGFLHEVPAEVLAAATAAFEALRADRNADLSHLATHRMRILAGELEPIGGRS